MAAKYVYNCDVCNREVKKNKLRELKVDDSLNYRIAPFKVFNGYAYQYFDICNKCYSKLRRYARKLKED